MKKYSGYDLIKPTDVELGEIIPSDSLVNGVCSCQYTNKHKKLTMKLISPYLRFFEDCIQLPNNQSIKYEYIANYSVHADNILMLCTFTDYFDECGIIKSDNISFIVIAFDNKHSIRRFKNLFLKKIMIYKTKNSFDKSIFNMKSFKTIYRRVITPASLTTGSREPLL